MSDKQYDNTNRGVLFRNSRKEKDTHADYRGHVNVGGVEYWLDGWIKESSKDGSQFMSLSIKPKQAAGPKQDMLTPTTTTPAASDPNDPIPF
jgi:hypothetical protein